MIYFIGVINIILMSNLMKNPLSISKYLIKGPIYINFYKLELD